MIILSVSVYNGQFSGLSKPSINEIASFIIILLIAKIYAPIITFEQLNYYFNVKSF
jgi:hypothetical protein